MTPKFVTGQRNFRPGVGEERNDGTRRWHIGPRFWFTKETTMQNRLMTAVLGAALLAFSPAYAQDKMNDHKMGDDKMSGDKMEKSDKKASKKKSKSQSQDKMQGSGDKMNDSTTKKDKM